MMIGLPRRFWFAVAWSIGLAARAVLAAETGTIRFDVAAGEANKTLKLFAQQANREIIFPARPVGAIKTNPVQGDFTVAAGLDRLLAGTELTAFVDEKSGGLVIQRTPDPNVPRAAPKPSDRPVGRKNRVTSEDSAPIELSPFEVRAGDDIGYQAANTTSGSRLNSRLKDTPASVSAFTPEFLADIAATNLEEMLAHATNVEVDIEDANLGFNNPSGRDATGTDYSFRMRGALAGAAIDFVDSSIPVDLYNMERAEVASGPNSILFGLGQAGGLVSLTGKRAHLARSRTTLKSLWGSRHFERYESDFNQVIVPRTLAVRLVGLYQNNQGWRYWDFNDQHRVTGAVAYQPFQNTKINASFERGRIDSNLTMGWNASDQITAWDKAGRPVADGAAVAGTNRLSAANNRFTFSEQDGVTYNLKGELQSSSLFSAVTLLPAEISPYNFNLTGPGGVRHQHITNYQVQVEQRLARNVTAELAFFHNKNDIIADGLNISAGGLDLRGDPNLTLPAPDGSTATVRNSRARQLFLETQWFRDTLVTANDVARLSVAWETGDSRRWFGRHRVAGLVEDVEQDRFKRWRNEILVDQDNVAVSNAGTPEAAVNQLTRRQYVAEGDFRTYYAGNSSVAMPAFDLGGRQIRSVFAARNAGNTHTEKSVGTLMLASQSFWWGDRIVTTLGARRDRIEFVNHEEGRITDPKDPRITSKRFALNEWDFDGTESKRVFNPTNYTAGAVWHATKRFSFFYNWSQNSGQPRLDKQVLPDGDIPPPTEGQGRDMGIMIDVLGDDRFFLRATRFETKQLKATPINASGTIGTNNLTNILNALLNAGRITRDQFDRQNVLYNTAQIDLFTKGVELEAVANPTRRLTLRATFSHSERHRENFFPDVYGFYGVKGPEWRALAAGNPALLAAINSELAMIDSELQAVADQQNSPFGTRPYKWNGTARYKFTEGRLRGAFLGGSLRYNGRNYLSTDSTGRVYWGNASLFGDAFAGYRLRLPRFHLPVAVQLNVKNISNSYLMRVGRYNDTYNGIRRIYLTEPRSYRLTTTVEF